MSFVSGILHYSNGIDCNKDCPCKGVKMSWSIWAAAQYGDLMSVATKISSNANTVNVEDEYGYTPMHFAAQHGHINVLHLLIKKGGKVNANTCGATPLHRAGRYECVKLLLENGANVNIKDTSFGDMNTPLHKAKLGGHHDIFELLLVSGADVNIINAKGNDASWGIDTPEEQTSIQPFQPFVVPSYTSLNLKMASSLFVECSHCNESALTFVKSKSGLLLCSDCVTKDRFLKLT